VGFVLCLGGTPGRPRASNTLGVRAFERASCRGLVYLRLKNRMVLVTARGRQVQCRPDVRVNIDGCLMPALEMHDSHIRLLPFGSWSAVASGSNIFLRSLYFVTCRAGLFIPLVLFNRRRLNSVSSPQSHCATLPETRDLASRALATRTSQSLPSHRAIPPAHGI